jgi:hypothetical protein
MTNDRKNPLRANFDLCSNSNVIWVVQSPLAKTFPFRRRANQRVGRKSVRVLRRKAFESGGMRHRYSALRADGRQYEGIVDGVTGPGLPSKQAALATALLMARFARLAMV